MGRHARRHPRRRRLPRRGRRRRRSASRASRRRAAAERTSSSSTSARAAPAGRREGAARRVRRRREGTRRRRISLEVLTANEPALARVATTRVRRRLYAMASPIAALERAPRRRAPGRTRRRRRTCRPTTRCRSSARSRSSSRASKTRTSGGRTAGSASSTRCSTTTARHTARFAKELSERLGAVTVALAREGDVVRFRLYERGRMVDEYLSVPTYYGALPKGDELALAANPTLVSRLTGADRDDVRRIARNALLPGRVAAGGGAVRADRGADGAGGMKLIDAARCPYCARARIALAEKGIDVRARRGRPRQPARSGSSTSTRRAAACPCSTTASRCRSPR